MSDTKELIVIEPNQIAAVFVESGLDPFIEKIKSEVEGIVPDLSTGKGRAEHIALSTKVRGGKTLLVKHGTALVDKLQKTRDEIVVDKDAQIEAAKKEINRMFEILTALQKEVRRPVSEWEEADKKKKAVEEGRIRAIKQRIEDIKYWMPLTNDGRNIPLHEAHPAEIEIAIQKLCEIDIETFQEFREEALTAWKTKKQEFENAFQLAKEKEELTAEKAKLKKKKYDDEVAAKAKRDAQKEYEAGIQKRIENIIWFSAKCDRSQTAESYIETLSNIDVDESFGDRQEYAQGLKNKTILNLKEQFKTLKEAEEKKIGEDKKEIKEKAVEDERKRIKGIQENEKARAQLRAADQDHRLKINNEILESLKDCGFDEEVRNKFLNRLVFGKIKNVFIKY